MDENDTRAVIRSLSEDLADALNIIEDVVNGGVCEQGALWPPHAKALLERRQTWRERN